jgi:uncharacterized protein
MQSADFIQQQTQLPSKGISGTVELLSEGATIPFIARYRKGQTEGLDEVQVGQIRDALAMHEQIVARQKTILKAISEQKQLDDSLEENILTCFDLQKLEDIYLPYKQKRVTKGEKAKKQGLEPLAKMIMAQRGGDPEVMAERYLKGDLVEVSDALEGARHIMSEWMNENIALRDRLRQLFRRHGKLTSKLVKGKEQEGERYKDYFEFEEPISRVAAHRFLAMTRGEKEGYLKLKVDVPKEEVSRVMNRFFVKGDDACADEVEWACKEAFQRLLKPSIETEMMKEARERADQHSFKIFAENLRQLLLAPPLGQKRILALDPGFKSGCKTVVIDENGTLLNNDVIYPHPPQKDMAGAKSKLSRLVESYKVDVIAVGDGTAGRETEFMLKKMHFNRDVEVYIVREDGASIYSASPIARKEFPQYDITVRGAVSIGRRLMDPLAELVKIDPKSLGVGSYQHEVNQTGLKTVLDDVVVSCVNAVGVDVNTASPYLLQYVSGLGPALAENIIKFRSENGKINSREDLKAVPRMGAKAFEQAAGFLRIRDGQNPLDNSAVHPEVYKMVQKMAKKLKSNVQDLIGKKELLDQLTAESFPEIDSFTFKDILEELRKPSRDPRKAAKVLEFDSRIQKIEDLIPGMELSGVITNVTAFGAFVNIGIKENGLIHKSNLSDQYVDDPSTVVRLNEHVKVKVLEVDVSRKRVGLARLN